MGERRQKKTIYPFFIFPPKNWDKMTVAFKLEDVGFENNQKVKKKKVFER
jgi:hypothetical protein